MPDFVSLNPGHLGREKKEPQALWRGTVSLGALCRGVKCTAILIAAVVGGFSQPNAASGAAIGSQLGNISGFRCGPRQAERPRADWASWLQLVVLADRPHQVP